MHAFEQQESRQTLAEGLREYCVANPGLASGRTLSPEAVEFFRCHDAAHVVFGCGNSLDDEAVVKVCSAFGTTAGLAVLRGYGLHESLQIYKTLRPSAIAATIARSVFLVPLAIARCARQRKRWPWSDFERHLDTPLGVLRGEYGIRVLHRAGEARK